MIVVEGGGWARGDSLCTLGGFHKTKIHLKITDKNQLETKQKKRQRYGDSEEHRFKEIIQILKEKNNNLSNRKESNIWNRNKRTYLFLKSFYLFLERGEGRVKDLERNINAQEKLQSIAAHTLPTLEHVP